MNKLPRLNGGGDRRKMQLKEPISCGKFAVRNDGCIPYIHDELRVC